MTLLGTYPSVVSWDHGGGVAADDRGRSGSDRAERAGRRAPQGVQRAWQRRRREARQAAVRRLAIVAPPSARRSPRP